MSENKLLVCTTEYYPHGSGIANVAHNIVKQLRTMGIDCKICSPTGPDICLGNRQLILKFGRLGLLYYWFKVSNHFKNNREYDMIWLHQPLFLFNNPFPKCLITMHITAFGHYNATKRLNYPLHLRIYYLFASILEKYCMRKLGTVPKITTDSPEVSQELFDMIGNDVKSTYIPNGVDTSKFKPRNDRQAIRNKFNIQHDEIVFLSIGRLSRQKKLFRMVDNFNLVQKSIENCSLIIGGTGELSQQLNNYIYTNKIKNVSLMGFIPDEELMELYACVDYYIMTSEYEGQPLTLLEAMASGLPCIVSDIPNLRIVEEADCGIIVDFSDKNKAANEIIDYVKHDNSEHGKNARKYAEEYLDWSIIAEKYLEQFEEML